MLYTDEEWPVKRNSFIDFFKTYKSQTKVCVRGYTVPQKKINNEQID